MIFSTKYLKLIINRFFNRHEKGSDRDILLFYTRRSGSTLLMEMIYSQSGIKYEADPFDVKHSHNLVDREELGMTDDHSHPRLVGFKSREQERRISGYFQDLLDGKRTVNPPWNIFDRKYDFRTHRSVIKITHAKSMINWFQKKFNVNVVFLLRHPIATALSISKFENKRGQTMEPVTESFLSNSLFQQKYLDQDLVNFINDIRNEENLFLNHILDWCLENWIPLNYLDQSDWLMITYEELVLNPQRMVSLLAEELDLSEEKKMYRQTKLPSNTSSSWMKKHLEDNSDFSKRKRMVTKWREEISENEEKKVFRILDKFDLEAYELGEYTAKQDFLHFKDTKKLISGQG